MEESVVSVCSVTVLSVCVCVLCLPVVCARGKCLCHMLGGWNDFVCVLGDMSVESVWA